MEWTRKQIDGMAELIKKEAIGGTLYGIPITEADNNVLLCAAYLFGKQTQKSEDEERKKNENS